MTLSRRDRAAMVLALECLRHVDTSESFCESTVELVADVMDFGSPFCWGIGEAADDTLNDGADPRLLRARLALYLRAVLRADARDFGPRMSWLRCRECGREKRWTAPSTMVCGYDEPRSTCRGLLEAFERGIRAYTPLWELAPATKGDR